jgi:hypothetical protein
MRRAIQNRRRQNVYRAAPLGPAGFSGGGVVVDEPLAIFAGTGGMDQYFDGWLVNA